MNNLVIKTICSFCFCYFACFGNGWAALPHLGPSRGYGQQTAKCKGGQRLRQSMQDLLPFGNLAFPCKDA
eukprot:1503651-Amphidinium_carterae.2